MGYFSPPIINHFFIGVSRLYMKPCNLVIIYLLKLYQFDWEKDKAFSILQYCSSEKDPKQKKS